MLNIITERKQLKIYTQKENIRESVQCKKNQHNKTEDSNEGNKGMKKMKTEKSKTCTKQTAKLQKSLLISNYFQCKMD